MAVHVFLPLSTITNQTVPENTGKMSNRGEFPLDII